jgi:ABC-2 type transport system ATP-binding protein
MNDTLIRAENLTKYYGNFPALIDASFEVHKGEIVGLLGPNGAGKTTLMQILTSIILPTSGHAWIGGFHVIEDSLRSRRMMGYCSEKSPLYLDMTVFKYLCYIGDLKEVKKKKERIVKLIVECGLESVIHRMIGKLSKGFRQRVSLAQALINDPPVLILDEPTIGLDPEQVREARTLIKQFSSERSTLISTHILYEAGILCDRVIIMDKGKILAVDSAARLEASLGGFHAISLVVEGPQDEMSAQLKMIPEVIDISLKGVPDHTNAHSFAIKTTNPESVLKEISRLARENGWGVLQLFKEQRSLEDIFHEIVAREK